MPFTGRRMHYTYEQYAALEDESPIRHESLAARPIARVSPDTFR